MTAEFALILPAVALLLAAGVGIVHLGAVQVALADAAADAARMIGRGDAAGAAGRIGSVSPGAGSTVEHAGPFVCVTATSPVTIGPLGALFSLTARGCALDDATQP